MIIAGSRPVSPGCFALMIERGRFPDAQLFTVNGASGTCPYSFMRFAYANSGKAYSVSEYSIPKQNNDAR